MKIAILGTRGIPARYGGFETFAEKLALGLVDRGHEVTVYCEKNHAAQPAIFGRVELRYRAAPALGPLKTILYDLNCLWAVRKSHDIVYMLGYGAAAFCLIPRFWGSQVWINPDGLEWKREKWGTIAKSYFKLMEWTSVRAADRVIADSAAIEAALVNRHGALRCCSVIAYGCDVVDSPPSTGPLERWDLKKDNYYLVVCRLEPENHVLEIVRAFQQSSSKKELIVIGNHLSQSSYVKQLAAIRDSRIRLVGTVFDQAALASLRWYSFAYLHGHSVGGTNPSLLEAMGCGNFIFAHDNSFNRETLGENGVYFSGVAELQDTIDRAERNEFDLAALKSGAKLRARQTYSWREIVSSYAALLDNSAERVR